MENLIEIRDLHQLGALLKAVRKRQHLRQDEVGRISHSFIGELEAGKPTAQIGKVMQAMSELGIRLHIELPAGMKVPNV